MNRMNRERIVFLAIAAATTLGLSSVGSVHAQQRQQQPLPEGYVRAGPVQTGLAPKMTVLERESTAHVFEVRFSTGDEILSGLNDLVTRNHITSGQITGIGGLSGALLGWGDPVTGAFKKIVIDDKTEIVSLIGDISERNGAPYVHVHMVVGFSDGTTKAGHLLEAHVAPIAELSVLATGIAAP